jgi:hypothetical protein
MSTFLELFVELHEASGAGGAAPSTTLAQTGEYRRLRNWVVRADFNIQTMWHDYKFLIDHDFTYDTVAGTQLKAPDTTWQRWDHKTFKIDNDPIDVIEYEKVKHEQFFITDAADRNQPDRIIIRPNGDLQFDPVPDDAYTITADHWLKPVKLSLTAAGTAGDDDKVSKIPTQWHDLIVAQALKYYATYENSDDALAHANEIWGTPNQPGMYKRFLSAERPDEFMSEYSSGNAIEVIAE